MIAVIFAVRPGEAPGQDDRRPKNESADLCALGGRGTRRLLELLPEFGAHLSPMPFNDCRERHLPFDRDRYAGLAEFRSTLRRFLAASEAISRACGITAQQYQALLAIGGGPDPMTMKDLAEQLLLQQHAASQMINRMQKSGLVDRVPSPTDRRSVLLTLTDAGGALLADLAKQHLAEVLKQEPHLSRSLRRLKQTADDDSNRN